jgi:hypothetical protein
MTSNSFHKFQKDPTSKYQQHIMKALRHSDPVVRKNQIKHLIQNKPRPRSLKAQIKIHKPDNPIRPVVNNICAPAYKVSKFMAKN